MIELIFWSLPVVIVLILLWKSREECPREILNWYCKGERCDHSAEAIQKAKDQR